MTESDKEFVEWLQDEIKCMQNVYDQCLKDEDYDFASIAGHRKSSLKIALNTFKQLKSEQKQRMKNE